MITRRDALQLAAAGFLIPSAGVFASTGTPEASPTASTGTSGTQRGSWPMPGGNPARSGVMPGPIPNLEQPIIVRWRFEPENDWLPNREPAVADGRVYLCGENTIYAIDVDSGLEHWRFELRGANYLTITEGVVYATTWDKSLHAISAENGLEIWRYSDTAGDGTPTASDAVFRSPAIVDSNVVIYGNGALHALDSAAGEVRWRFPLNGWDFDPVVARGLVFGSNEGGISAVDLATGQEQWRSSSASGVAAVVDTMVLAAEASHLSGIDLETGQELWRHSLQNVEIRGAGVSDTHFFILGFIMDENGNVDAEIQAIDIATGGLLWMYSLGENLHFWGTEMRIVDDQMIVKIGDPQNQLLVIDIATGLKTWEYRGYITEVYPVAVDHNLYFVHDSELFAIGNLLDPVLISDVTLRAAPAASGLERGTASAGDAIDHVGARSESDGELWVEISVGGVSGWIPASAIDPTTLPPEGDIWVLYDPAWF